MIQFYSTKGDYGCFSNFYYCQIKLDGHTWKTSEHYFQAQKFAGTNLESKIRNVKSPREAADIGRDKNNPLRRDWESVKDEIMYKVVKAKFSQHIDLQRILLDTGEEEIVEHTEKDTYWADGGNGTGKNKLGKILMRVRKELKEKQNAT